jgi:putative tryptophan/tyrosine transport system substrate-binding protein
MRRRDFIAGLGSAVAWPLVAWAQQPTMPVIGYLSFGTPEMGREIVAAVHRGLSETGYVEGRNLAVEYRWSGDQNGPFPALADDLVRRKVAVMVATPMPAAVAAKAATKSIPIVFFGGTDPVAAGLVASLNRPGGNLTGIFNLNATVVAKRLELLHELIAAAPSIAFLVNPANSVFAETETRELRAAARILGVKLLILNATGPDEFEAAFATLVAERAGGFLASTDVLFFMHSDRLVALAARHRVPAIFPRREDAAAGGLMSYGVDYPNAWRQVGVYTGRILKGEKPADLPVQQSTKIELVINMKTAKALGITFPTALLVRANEVIE